MLELTIFIMSFGSTFTLGFLINNKCQRDAERKHERDNGNDKG